MEYILDDLFSRLLAENTPIANPYVMNGLACHYMKKAEQYIDDVFRSASNSFPAGLVYDGYERCTPIEEYEESTKVKNNKRTFDLAKSDLYLVKYKFSFNGIPIAHRYIYLPYVNDGSIFSLGGAKFHITPVLSDKVISPGFDNIFVRLLRDKMIFRRCYHTFIIDDIRETTHVVWSQIYRRPKDNSKKIPNTTKAMTCITHYLFAKYGVSKTFQKYAGFVPVVGEEEINTTTYPKDKWIICESSGVKPKTYMGEFYEPTKIRVAIPRDKLSTISKSLLIGLFYIIDHFPNRFKPAYLDQTNLFMILLGHIVFSGVYGENKLYSSIEEHFISLDDYVDPIVIGKLKESNYHIKDFYDLLALILNNFNSLVLESENSSLSMYGKSLEVLYYVLYDITVGIFRVNFKLSKLASKKVLSAEGVMIPKPLSLKDITETFNKNMKMGAIFGLASGKIITESVSYSGDHKYPKITSKITEQEALPGATRGRSKRLVVGEDKHIDISMVEAGSVLYLSKSNPTPTNRVNPFIILDIATGTILPNPKFKELRDRTQAILKGKI